MLHVAVHPSLPASGVTHAISGRFSHSLPETTKEVVLVCENQLKLYRSDATVPTSPMEYVTECALYAPPLSVATCRAPGSSTNVIALLFDDFHVSFIQYDPLCLQFDTIALVQLDDRNMFMERCALKPILRVDPTERFVAVLAKRRELFIFPLLKKVSKDEAVITAASRCDKRDGRSVGKEEDTQASVDMSAGDEGKTVCKVALSAWGDEDEDEERTVPDVVENDNDCDEKAAQVDAVPHGSLPMASNDETAPGTSLGGKIATGSHHHNLGSKGTILLVGPITQVSLRDIKKTLRNVRDFQFVESSGGEPLLAFLYEKQPSWAGRVRLIEWRSKSIESNMLTCSIVWIKMTLVASTQPTFLPIGDVDHLPYNTTHLTPVSAFHEVPSAVLAVGRNVLAHVNTKNGYGVYINNNGREEVQHIRSSTMVYEAMQWFDTAQEHSEELVRTNLCFANASVLPLLNFLSPAWRDAIGKADSASGNNPQLLLVTEDEGTIVEITAQTQGYVISGFTSRILMNGCFCSSYCDAGPGRLFLGSCRGDSRLVLLENSRSSPIKVIQTIWGLAPLHDAALVDWTHSIAAEAGPHHARNIDETVIFDDTVENSPYAKLYHSVTLDPTPQVSPFQRRHAIDLAVCSGFGASGALCLLRHTIRNYIIRQEEVNAISVFFLGSHRQGSVVTIIEDRKRARQHDVADGDDWVPMDGNQGDNAASITGSSHTPHLLMTGSRFTILFAVRSDSVQQVRGTVFNIMSRTIFADELETLPALLQVTETEFRLVSLDGKRTLQHVVFGAMAVLADCGSARAAFLALLGIASTTEELLFVHFENGSLIRFSLSDLNSAPVSQHTFSNVVAVCLRAKVSQLVMIHNMDLVMYSLARQQVCGVFPNFALLPPTALEGMPTPLTKLADRLNEEPLPRVTHVRVFEHPRSSSPSPAVSAPLVECTLVLIVSSGELLTYKLLALDAHGPCRLLKHTHHFLDVTPQREVMESIEEKKRRLAEERAHVEQGVTQAHRASERLISFSNIGGHAGVYVCGQHPIFLLYDTHRQELIATRHQVTGTVRGFAPFHSRHVEAGYVFCSEGYVHFATMQPSGQSLGHGWWAQRVPLGKTPHHVVYSAAARSCFVVTSTPFPFSPKRAFFDAQLQIHYNHDDTQTVAVEEPTTLPPLSSAAGAPVPLNERYEVQFMSCDDHQRKGCFVLEENEKVLSARCVDIPRDTSLDSLPRSGVSPVCVLATAFPLGEDVTTRGRLVLLATKHVRGVCEMVLLHSEPLRGPVTAVAAIQGNIAIAVSGAIRIVRYDYKEKKMETMAILYAGAYVTHISAFRDFIIFGDLYNSATLARFNASKRTLTIIGKDLNRFSVVHADMLYHGSAFGLIVTDDERNVAVLGYTPRVQGNSESGQPSKLLESLLSVEGQYRMPGGSVLKFLRLRSSAQEPAVSTSLYVTNYGEVGFLVPLSEQINRTGQWVTRRLQSDITHPAGLPPRMFLGFTQDDCIFSIKARETMLHAPLLNELLRLDLRTRKSVAAAAQTQLDRALNVAAIIYMETCQF